MENTKTFPDIALGTWSWGVGAAGGDQVFGNHLGKEELKAVFDAGMKAGLNLWAVSYTHLDVYKRQRLSLYR